MTGVERRWIFYSPSPSSCTNIWGSYFGSSSNPHRELCMPFSICFTNSASTPHKGCISLCYYRSWNTVTAYLMV